MTAIDSLLTIGIAAAPVFELRGAIPFALARGAEPALALCLSLVGNLLVIPCLLWGLTLIERLLMRWSFTERLLSRVFARSRRKGRWIERWGMLGLFLLVAIPLPGTGAWTGSIAAFLLGVPVRRALPWIALGVLVAGIVVTLASLGVIAAFGL